MGRAWSTGTWLKVELNSPLTLLLWVGSGASSGVVGRGQLKHPSGEDWTGCVFSVFLSCPREGCIQMPRAWIRWETPGHGKQCWGVRYEAVKGLIHLLPTALKLPPPALALVPLSSHQFPSVWFFFLLELQDLVCCLSCAPALSPVLQSLLSCAPALSLLCSHLGKAGQSRMEDNLSSDS